MDKRDGGPAYPAHLRGNTGTDSVSFQSSSGMSLRDYFAGQALAGLMAMPSLDLKANNAQLAGVAYSLADAMIAERDKPHAD